MLPLLSRSNLVRLSFLTALCELNYNKNMHILKKFYVSITFYASFVYKMNTGRREASCGPYKE